MAQPTEELSDFLVRLRVALGDGEADSDADELIAWVERLVAERTWQPPETAPDNGDRRVLVSTPSGVQMAMPSSYPDGARARIWWMHPPEPHDS